MSLYNQHRPAKLEDVFGNEEIKKSIADLLSKESKPHVWLLTGEAGTGKTTIARIIAKMLGSEDVSEYNIGDLRGIDNIRELADKSVYKPFTGECSVYILDEVAGLTKDSQVCLLKLLEDTPAHAYFILCTTDPEKLSKPIRSRCITLETKPLSTVDMKKLLTKIASIQDVSVSEIKVNMICRVAGGSARTALTMLESVLGLSDEEAVRLLASTVIASEDPEINEFVKALVSDNASWSSVSAILRKFDGKSAESIRMAVVNYAAAVLKNRDSIRHYLILDSFKSPFYDGMSALVRCAYEVVKGGAK